MSADPSKCVPGKYRAERAGKTGPQYSNAFLRWDDQTAVTEEERLERMQNAVEHVEAYYDFATIAKIHGWSTHLHYTPFAPNESIDQAMAHYAHRIAAAAGLKPGMKVLDVGCGVGGPAREIAKFAGCDIIGISINELQLDYATEMTAQVGLGDRIAYVHGDFLNMPFPDASFDAAYAIEATCHSPSLAAVYASVARVLKPGALFFLSEWVMTPKYDAANPRHVGIRNRIERGNGIMNMCTEAECKRALAAAGFSIEYDEDYAHHWDRLSREDHPTSAPWSSLELPSDDAHKPKAHVPKTPINCQPARFRAWYYPLKGWTSMCVTRQDWRVTFKLTPTYRFLWFWFCVLMVKIGWMNKDLIGMMKELQFTVDGVVEGAEIDIFTPCWFHLCRKTGEVDEVFLEKERVKVSGKDGRQGKGK